MSEMTKLEEIINELKIRKDCRRAFRMDLFFLFSPMTMIFSFKRGCFYPQILLKTRFKEYVFFNGRQWWKWTLTPEPEVVRGTHIIKGEDGELFDKPLTLEK